MGCERESQKKHIGFESSYSPGPPIYRSLVRHEVAAILRVQVNQWLPNPQLLLTNLTALSIFSPIVPSGKWSLSLPESINPCFGYLHSLCITLASLLFVTLTEGFPLLNAVRNLSFVRFHAAIDVCAQIGAVTIVTEINLSALVAVLANGVSFRSRRRKLLFCCPTKSQRIVYFANDMLAHNIHAHERRHSCWEKTIRTSAVLPTVRRSYETKSR